MSKRKRESRTRSVAKGLTWRVIASLDTMIIAFLLTGGDTKIAVSIGVLEVITKFILYYLHERGWQMIPLGTVDNLIQKTLGRTKAN